MHNTSLRCGQWGRSAALAALTRRARPSHFDNVQKMSDANTHNSAPDGSEKSQTQFVRQLNARDEASWREFYERHRQEIFSRARTRGLNHAEAEEVVQETFLTLYKKID